MKRHILNEATGYWHLCEVSEDPIENIDYKTYLITDGYRYKIGRSIDPINRMKHIKTANPTAQLVSFGKGITEKQLHYIFREKRISGEWFDLNKYDVINILSLLKPNQDN